MRDIEISPSSIPVRLEVKEFKQPAREVASYTIQFNQPTDIEGQIAGNVRGGKINLRLKVLNIGNTDLVRWMTNDWEVHDGEILFINTTNGNKMKTLAFEKAYCVDYIEHWEDDIYEPLLAHWEEITISCKKITIEQAEFENTWELENGPKTNL